MKYFKIFFFFVFLNNSTLGLASVFTIVKQDNPQCYYLKEYLDMYKKIQSVGGWKPIITRDTFQLADVQKEVRDLKIRLSLTGELPAISIVISDTFNVSLENAVKRFQKGHKIDPKGIVDQRTLFELNVPVEKRIQQIELNMERWKNMTANLGDQYLWVNIADNSLNLIKTDSIVLSMKVIVGRFYRKTPVFQADLNMIELNPFWVIPPGIMKKDILPKITKDHSFLEKNNMQVFYKDAKLNPSEINWSNEYDNLLAYKIIQNPGPGNPLGVVKFIFPNNYFVYMHDTPNKNLFEMSSPAFSSGCIRLSKAVELAEYVLKNDKQWTEKITDSLIATGKNKKIKLNKTVKVYICYFTAWVNKDGELQFAPDIYKRDL